LNKIFLYLFLFLLFCFHNLSAADEKEDIINKFKNINSLKFNFQQITNEVIETGHCELVFPNKLKCNYNDKNQKELIINNSRLAITQKRYNKTFYYSVKKSPFLKILNKNQLNKLIEESVLKNINSQIHLINLSENEEKILIIFDEKNFNLIGWKINDQFKNSVTFLIEIISTNESFDLKKFEIKY
tara:strand:- start:3609 stop:4166 length:558 start_codon:yes stop_codon:yes gene_type:complete